MAYKVSIKTGIKNGKEWKGLLIEIGEWSTLYFPKSKFEMDYIIKQLSGDKEIK